MQRTKKQSLLHSSFQLIDNEDEYLSGEKIAKLKEFIAKKYLIILPNYGTFILRSNKDNFDVAVASLRKYIWRFQKRVKSKLQKGIDENRQALVKALSPSVIKSYPARWTRYLGGDPSESEVKDMLDSELAKLFGTAEENIGRIEVKLMYKGVTYEILSDGKFVSLAQSKIPNLRFAHEEYDAARESKQLPHI